MSCDSKMQPPPLGGYTDYEYFNDDVEESILAPTSMDMKQKEGAEHKDIPTHIYEIWTYVPQQINVPAQTALEHVVCNEYPNLQGCYNYNCIGGPKLIGEMAADKAGYYYSFYTCPIKLNILPLSGLHLDFLTSPKNIVCQVLDGNVVIQYAKIIRLTLGMALEIVVKNISQIDQSVVFEQGQMVEVASNHVQNVVIAARDQEQIPSQNSKKIVMPIFCAAQHRTSPVGKSARMTPYVMKAPISAFRSQQNIWDYIESDDNPNSYVTFYVWGKGTITSSGMPSPTGHAFVRIPNLGVIGFGSLHGGIFDDEGIVFDHSSKIRYATDSCRIKVSDEAMMAMKKKVEYLQRNVPRYKIGRYDCTSFVMDVADAGGIQYGYRITIQTPVGFMEELKKHNNFN